MGIHLAAVAALRRLDAGALYFWIKDLTQEFLKLSIIYSSVEIFDKVKPASLRRRDRAWLVEWWPITRLSCVAAMNHVTHAGARIYLAIRMTAVSWVRGTRLHAHSKMSMAPRPAACAL